VDDINIIQIGNVMRTNINYIIHMKINPKRVVTVQTHTHTHIYVPIQHYLLEERNKHS